MRRFNENPPTTYKLLLKEALILSLSSLIKLPMQLCRTASPVLPDTEFSAVFPFPPSDPCPFLLFPLISEGSPDPLPTFNEAQSFPTAFLFRVPGEENLYRDRWPSKTDLFYFMSYLHRFSARINGRLGNPNAEKASDRRLTS